MKKNILAAIAAVITFSSAAVAATNVAVDAKNTVQISRLQVTNNGTSLTVAFDIDASRLPLKSNQEVYITPTISNEYNLETLPPLLVSGRNRMYWHMRNDDDAWTLGRNMFHNGTDAASIAYSANIPYQPWMQYSRLSVDYTAGGCADCIAHSGSQGTISVPLATIDMRPAQFTADYIYSAPKGDGVKYRKDSGTAYIDFKVGKTDILPDFRNNAAELAKISGTIDRVKSDKDYTITAIKIEGFASPEGPYTLNERLAAGRAEALLGYVKSLYDFPKTVKFTSSSVAEDWAGLRRWVAASDLERKDAILALIDNNALTPDEKDAKIRSQFPVDYPFLLDNVYPSLRHSDYEIDYTVREFTNVDEIKQLIRTAPQKLGMNEFYLAAQTYKPGSPEYIGVFETAVRMYPDNPVACLNAANAAMEKGDMQTAKRLLAKAGDSEQAWYARGMYDALQKDWQSALANFRKAPRLAAQTGVIDQVLLCIDRPEGSVRLTPLR